MLELMRGFSGFYLLPRQERQHSLRVDDSKR